MITKVTHPSVTHVWLYGRRMTAWEYDFDRTLRKIEIEHGAEVLAKWLKDRWDAKAKEALKRDW